MCAQKGTKYRSRAEVQAEAKKVLAFVKAAPKSGRRYIDMVEKVFDLRGGEKTFHGHFDYFLDRNLLTPIMPHLKRAGVTKCADGRYRV